MLAQTLDTRPWDFQWHPEVWLLVAALTVSYVYMVRVIGPRAVGVGNPAVTRGNVYSFIAAMAMLWIASDWPIHDIGEDYLYSAHMLQHMMLTYFLPPLALMATPTWLMRVLVGDGRVYRTQAGLRQFPVGSGRLMPSFPSCSRTACRRWYCVSVIGPVYTSLWSLRGGYCT